ncbi:uncharacterized protein LOC132751107, partial [Ruditapes philippinarum]|uniref:uncharacterized protein LOC132751107 n=1 Tax=Ruditapes philippinarum TaxID=129788 RepID=UPI00295ADDB8
GRNTYTGSGFEGVHVGFTGRVTPGLIQFPNVHPFPNNHEGDRRHRDMSYDEARAIQDQEEGRGSRPYSTFRSPFSPVYSNAPAMFGWRGQGPSFQFHRGFGGFGGFLHHNALHGPHDMHYRRPLPHVIGNAYDSPFPRFQPSKPPPFSRGIMSHPPMFRYEPAHAPSYEPAHALYPYNSMHRPFVPFVAPQKGYYK